MKVIPVLLSGGTGTRLWPLSRETYPKQLLPLVGPETLLQATAQRAMDRTLFTAPIVIAHVEHRFVIAEQLRSIGLTSPQIVLEPEGRNTAPAVAIGALLAAGADPNSILLVMPADHVIPDVTAFHRAIEIGIPAAAAGALVLFGIRPVRPETGYGYIRVGNPLENAPGVHQVDAFAEKPDPSTAERYLASGDYVWNSGIFLLNARVVLRELERLQPEVLAAAKRAIADGASDLDFLRLDSEAFRSAPSISFDHSVLEHTARAAVVPADFPWSDVGSWSALWELEQKDGAGNVVLGDAFVDQSRNSYVRGEGLLVSAIGVEGLIIVATPDAVLVTAKASDQNVKQMVEQLKGSGHHAATQTQRVHRPWGYYQSIHTGDRFQVKRITVSPGAKLSLQKHFHRAEHWIVVNGTAAVSRDGEEILLRENESVFLPLGCVHRLHNPGRVPLNLIEVQSGPYLEEDDIVRLEDDYARL